MTQIIQPAILLVIAVLLIVEATVLFFIFRRYHRKKIHLQQKQFAGYLDLLDKENKKLKTKLAKHQS